MSSLIDSSILINPIYQINNNNLLFDLAKINCELIFINKENDFTFYENFKRLLSTSINIIPLNIIDEEKTYLYIKYYEGNKEIESFSELVINKKMCIRLYITEDNIEIRNKLIQLYHNDITALNDPSMEKKSRLIFLFDNKLQNEKESSSDKNVYYINKGKKTILQEMKVIITDVIVNGYVNEINENNSFNPSINFKKNLNIVYQRISELIHIQKINECINIIDKCISEFSGFEKGKFEEIKALCLLYIDMKKKINTNLLAFNKEILPLFENAIKIYKKENKRKLLIDCYIRMLFYFSFFQWNDFHFLETNIYHLFNKINDKNYDEIEAFVNYLKISDIYKNLKMKRKMSQYYFLAFNICLNCDKLKSMIPSMIEEISKYFNIYNISKNVIEDYDDFIHIHKYLILNTRKPVCTFLYNKEKKNFELTTRRKFDKSHTINIKKNIKQISNFIFQYFWKHLQSGLNDKIINYYNNNNDYHNSIMFTLGYIQTLHDTIKEKKQNEFLKFHTEKSLNFQGKIFVNLCKIPILIKLIPLTSKIKFDISPNRKKEKTNDSQKKIFLYNPWEQKSQINYYWTSNSFQRIKIEFFNPLKIPIEISKIRILFKGILPFSYPFNIKINPNENISIIAKIKANNISGITNIIGIKYEIINSIGIQFVDNNGNGLFSNYENYNEDNNNNIEKEKISLKNIMIYPEIAELTFKILDKSFDIINQDLILYDYQYYTFSFLLENKGKFQIDKLHCYIYTYKKNNYKISLDEIVQDVKIKPGENYIFKYKYWHRGIYIKIDFKIFYISNEKNNISEKEDDYIIKPYLFYSKKLQTLHLIDFINKKIIPILSSNDSLELSKRDDRIKKNYLRQFSSETNCFSLIIQNPNESSIKIEFYDIEQNKIIRKEKCDGFKFKEISCVVNSKINFDKIILRWIFTDLENINGKIHLNQIYSDLIYSLFNPFSFQINFNVLTDQFDNKFIQCFYIIKNNKNKSEKDLKLIIYLYQKIEERDEGENYIFNNELKDNVFIEGNLNVDIDKIDSNDFFNYDIKIYPIKNLNLFTTLFIIDKKNKNIFLCPYSKKIMVN